MKLFSRIMMALAVGIATAAGLGSLIGGFIMCLVYLPHGWAELSAVAWLGFYYGAVCSMIESK